MVDEDVELPESTNMSSSRPCIHARSWNALVETPLDSVEREMAITVSRQLGLEAMVVC